MTTLRFASRTGGADHIVTLNGARATCTCTAGQFGRPCWAVEAALSDVTPLTVEQPAPLAVESLPELNDLHLSRAAVAYAEAGWPVHPLVPGAKTPITSNGNQDATTDLYQVREWWARWPNANIGIRTGTVDVLDLDGPEGQASFVERVPGYFHRGPLAASANGWHLYFGPTGSNNKAHLLPGVDFRGDGGYIIAPPSVHPSGVRYRWVRGSLLEALPPMPHWLAELLEVEPSNLIPFRAVSGERER